MKDLIGTKSRIFQDKFKDSCSETLKENNTFKLFKGVMHHSNKNASNIVGNTESY